MPTNVGDVPDLTLQKFADAVASSLRLQGGGGYAAAPNAFKDSQGDTLSSTTPSGSSVLPNSEVTITVTINRGGMSATGKIQVRGSKGLPDLHGAIDIATLATKLV